MMKVKTSYQKLEDWLSKNGGVSKQPPTYTNISPVASAPPVFYRRYKTYINYKYYTLTKS